MGVTNVGINHVLDVVFHGTAPSGTWYLGLISGSATLAASDTMASHSGWTENTNYAEANRVTWPEDAAASQSITNTTTADFSINTNSQSIYGLFLVDNNTKGGTSGTLFATAAFSGGTQILNSGDTLQATFTISGQNV